MKKNTKVRVIILCAILVAAVILGVFFLNPQSAERGTWQYTIVVEPQYREITSIYDGAAVVVTAVDRQHAVIDGTGEYIVPPGRYDHIWFYRGFARVGVLNDRVFPRAYEWGLINTRGEELIPIGEGVMLLSVAGGLAAVSVGYGIDTETFLIDTNGERIYLPRQYGNISPSECGLIFVSYSEKWSSLRDEIRDGLWYNRTLPVLWDTWLWGVADRTGTEIIPPQFNELMSFSEGLAAVRIGDWHSGKWGFIDMTGAMVIAPQFDGIMSFSEGFAGVLYNGLWGFIDKTGAMVIPPQFDHVWPFSEGFSVVSYDGQRSFIDTTGELIVPFGRFRRFDIILPFSGGFSAVGIRDVDTRVRWGFMDTTGAEIIPPQFNDIRLHGWDGFGRVDLSPFEKDLALGQYNDYWGIIEIATGVHIITPKYTEMRWIYDGLAAVRYNNQWGIIEIATGAEIVPFGQFNGIGYGGPVDGLVAVRYGGLGRWGLIHLERIPDEAHNRWITLIIGAVVAAVVFFAARKIYIDRKKGRGSACAGLSRADCSDRDGSGEFSNPDDG